MKKFCGKCKKTKLSKFFAKQSRYKDGLQKWCKKCKREYDKKYYLEHSDKTRERNNNSKERNRTFIQKYLMAHPCIDCGETDIVVLDFDHVRGKKIDEVSALALQGAALKTIETEIAKCEIRCANDHRRKTALDRLRVRSIGRTIPSEGIYQGSNP